MHIQFAHLFYSIEDETRVLFLYASYSLILLQLHVGHPFLSKTRSAQPKRYLAHLHAGHLVVVTVGFWLLLSLARRITEMRIREMLTGSTNSLGKLRLNNVEHVFILMMSTMDLNLLQASTYLSQRLFQHNS